MHLKKRQYAVRPIPDDPAWLYRPARFQTWRSLMGHSMKWAVSFDWKEWLLDVLLGKPALRFIYERDGVMIALEADRWQVKHGYLEKCFPDGVREDITQPILLFQNRADLDESFYLCPSVIFRLSYQNVIKMHQIEQGVW